MPTAAIDGLSVRALTTRDRLYALQLRAVRQLTIRLRRAYYVDQPSWTSLLRRLPDRVQQRIGLDDPEVLLSRKIELGGGPYPLPGYIHVDADWRANHLEAIATGESLPFPTAFADEIVAIHLLEHVHPTAVDETLREWRRVLKPDGMLQVHVPNFDALSEKFLSAAPAEKWKFLSAILGMLYSGTDATGPMEVHQARSDHQLALDWPLLERILCDAGFERVENVSATVSDRHTEGWAPAMDQISLIARAYTPSQ